jgi:hypothetical protein
MPGHEMKVPGCPLAGSARGIDVPVRIFFIPFFNPRNNLFQLFQSFHWFHRLLSVLLDVGGSADTSLAKIKLIILMKDYHPLTKVHVRLKA